MKRAILFLILLICIGVAYADPSLNQSNITAQGGNVTFLDVNLSQQNTNIWQGFYGNVTGGIFLKDANEFVFYDWNVVDSVGEVLATRFLISDWNLINCTNQTEIYQEEERLNIPNSTNMGINDTYMNTTHPDFTVAGRPLTGCRSTLMHNSTSSQAVFWNVLLNSNSTSTVYTVILDNDKDSYDGGTADFQLLVPVDLNTGTAQYNMYVELT